MTFADGTLPALLATPYVGAAFGLAAGLLIGAVHFGSLRWNADAYLAGSRIALAILLQLVRFALLGAVLYGLSRLGALPLLAGALGILLARAAVIRLTRPAGEPRP